MAPAKTGIRTTTKPGWTIPIDFIDRFAAIALKRRMKPSQLLTQLIREFLEQNE